MGKHDQGDYEELDIYGNRYRDTEETEGEEYQELSALESSSRNSTGSFSFVMHYILIFFLVIIVAITLLLVFGVVPISFVLTLLGFAQ